MGVGRAKGRLEGSRAFTGPSFVALNPLGQKAPSLLGLELGVKEAADAQQELLTGCTLSSAAMEISSVQALP